MMQKLRVYLKWLSPGLHIKRWLFLLMAGITLLSIGIAQIIVELYRYQELPNTLALLTLRSVPIIPRLLIAAIVGGGLIIWGLYELNRTLLVPFRRNQHQPFADVFYAHQQRRKGPSVVAIGGGTGLPSVLRGMKRHTSNITAIVTVADNGGSSGRLRREMGILPPGDLRNNIAALADDEDLMTQLFQYRFSTGDLDGHSFGNLFLTALSDITGSMEHALLETERVLAVQGNVLPATLDDVTLRGEVWHPDDNALRSITGESEIAEVHGRIERVSLDPAHSRAYPRSVQAILSADLIVLGPGSLFTSILPSLLINGIVEAIRASQGLCVYICNVATQPGETDNFDVTDHILALEKHVGQHLFKMVIANNRFAEPRGKTEYVLPARENDEVNTRYDIVYADLTDKAYPWRHDPVKLAGVLQSCYANFQANPTQLEPA
jgi:uncharacterized cofD-like protein